jgi:hypothetical protein
MMCSATDKTVINDSTHSGGAHTSIIVITQVRQDYDQITPSRIVRARSHEKCNGTVPRQR